jgi:hypothetical protein
MMGEPSREDQLNITELANHPGWKAEIKTAEEPLELEHRLQEAAYDGKFRRWRDLFGFLFFLFGLAIIVAICFGIARDPQASADDKKWATAALTGIISAATAYVAGKNSK